MLPLAFGGQGAQAAVAASVDTHVACGKRSMPSPSMPWRRTLEVGTSIIPYHHKNREFFFFFLNLEMKMSLRNECHIHVRGVGNGKKN